MSYQGAKYSLLSSFMRFIILLTHNKHSIPQYLVIFIPRFPGVKWIPMQTQFPLKSHLLCDVGLSTLGPIVQSWTNLIEGQRFQMSFQMKERHWKPSSFLGRSSSRTQKPQITHSMPCPGWWDTARTGMSGIAWVVRHKYGNTRLH